MSNRTRHHRRRRGRGTRLRGVSWVDQVNATARLDACDCPALITPGDPIIVEHFHRHGCPELKRWPT